MGNFWGRFTWKHQVSQNCYMQSQILVSLLAVSMYLHENTRYRFHKKTPNIVYKVSVASFSKTVSYFFSTILGSNPCLQQFCGFFTRTLTQKDVTCVHDWTRQKLFHNSFLPGTS